MSDLAQLIEDLESAQVGSLHYDKRILAALGFTWRGMAYWNSQEQWKGSAALTRSMDAIVALIERSDWKLYSVDASIDGRPSCFIKGPDRVWPADDESDEHFGPGWEHGRAKSLPLALCIAFLKAMEQADG